MAIAIEIVFTMVVTLRFITFTMWTKCSVFACTIKAKSSLMHSFFISIYPLRISRFVTSDSVRSNGRNIDVNATGVM